MAGGTAAPRSRDCQGLGAGRGIRKAGVLSFVTLGEAGWVLPLPPGLLGMFSVAPFTVGRAVDVSSTHSARTVVGSGSTRATDRQTQTSAAPEIQVKLKAALPLGCLALGSTQAF